jgi:hypothetical protein
MDKSEFFLSWHMIVREDTENMIKCLDSLQGLYDECIVAVDDRSESDEVFKAIKIFPHVVAYRQKWPGRFDICRQEVLRRVSPDATYIGCCDSDEFLVQPSPRELRDLLFQEQPNAVNLAIRYQAQVGPNNPGSLYLRTKIWKTTYPRSWVGRIHEYPACTGEFVCPTPYCNIIFDHGKVDHKLYRTDYIISCMLDDISKGFTRWYPYLGEEYRADGRYKEALEACKSYLFLDIKDREWNQHLKKCLNELILIFSLIHNGDEKLKWEAFRSLLQEVDKAVPFLKKSAIFWEYYSIPWYYLEGSDASREFHEIAKSLDPEKKQDFIWNNDRYY